MAYATITPTLTGTNTEALAKVEAEIDAQRRKLVDLYSIRNSLLPVSSLPSEVLSRVFSFVPVEKATVLSVTHVSQYWRYVALGDPSLWTQIDGGNVHLAGLFAERSRNLALSVNLGLCDLDEHKQVDVILASFDRVRDLTLCGPAGPPSTWTSRDPFLVWAKSARTLETLCLSRMKVSRRKVPFSRDAPRLRLLSLQNVTFRCSSFRRFTSLTTLRIEEPANEVLLHDIGRLLAATPLLQYLVLDRVQFIDNGDTMKPLQLPCLVDLTLGLVSYDTEPHLVAVIRLLDSLDLPPTTNRSLIFNSYEAEAFEGLLSSVTSHFTSNNPIHTVNALIDRRFCLSLTIYPPPTHGMEDTGKVNISTTTACIGTTVCHSVFIAALDFLPLTTAQIIDLDMPISTFYQPSPHGIIDRFFGARELHVYNAGAELLFRYLWDVLARDWTITSFFPKLEMLGWRYGNLDMMVHQESLTLCDAALQNRFVKDNVSSDEMGTLFCNFLGDLFGSLNAGDEESE
ncbi:hypothetical protein BDN72DRAFT_218500 [Pluteus cervinus]|uniref:Uncharacterized protein n=1 Tax=Pluteus cervinus TaxID=181527 RepID=A0ACD3AI88_9AGAR|nr:hypothetical protein BDN72DRAFT_218500 [Pluteus cervinus]